MNKKGHLTNVKAHTHTFLQPLALICLDMICIWCQNIE